MPEAKNAKPIAKLPQAGNVAQIAAAALVIANSAETVLRSHSAKLWSCRLATVAAALGGRRRAMYYLPD